jgi:hypothetical protein
MLSRFNSALAAAGMLAVFRSDLLGQFAREEGDPGSPEGAPTSIQSMQKIVERGRTELAQRYPPSLRLRGHDEHAPVRTWGALGESTPIW